MALLINAVKSAHICQVKYFLKAGIDVNITDENSQTAVIHCCFLEDETKRLKILRLLLAQDVDVNKKDRYGRSLVSWICFLGRTDSFAFLLDQFDLPVDFDLYDEEGNSLLMLGVLSGSIKMVSLLLEVLKEFSLLDRQVNCFNDKGMCPLIIAFQRKDHECARLLVNEGKASVASVLQSIHQANTRRRRFLENVNAPSRGQAFYTFMRAGKFDPKNAIKLPTEQELLEFLFLDRENSTGTKEHEKKGETKSRAHSAYPSRNNLNLDSKTALKRRHLSAKPILGNSGEHSTVPSIVATVSIETDISRSKSSRGTFSPSFTGLYEIYSTQLSISYRQGIHTPKPSPPSPPSVQDTPPPSTKEQETSHPSRRRSLQRHSSNISEKTTKGFSLSKRNSNLTSSSVLAPLEESSFDRQMRLKYARSTRATSVQVAKFPQISATTKRRNRSTTISQL